MKFLITGHTRGIGKAIYEKFGGIGLSRSTGFDITQNDISPYLNNIDVFVNNAFSSLDYWSQVKLVYQAKNVPRQIVIGSMASDYAYFHTTSDQGYEYSAFKLALEAACHQCFNENQNTTLIKPAFVDTDSCKKVDTIGNKKLDYYKKLKPTDLVNLIDFIIKQPYKIKEITLAA